VSYRLRPVDAGEIQAWCKGAKQRSRIGDLVRALVIDHPLMSAMTATRRKSTFGRPRSCCRPAMASERLTVPDQRGLHLFERERLADAAVKNGLYDSLIECSG
jgi:hypothetical protein